MLTPGNENGRVVPASDELRFSFRPHRDDEIVGASLESNVAVILGGSRTSAAFRCARVEGTLGPDRSVDVLGLHHMHGVIGKVENGAVRIDEPISWEEGQRVLVIALPAGQPLGMSPPPPDLLAEDSRELALRADIRDRINRGELD